MFGREATLPVDWVFPTPSVDKRTMYQWNGDMLEEKQRVYKSMREVQGGRVRQNTQMYKPLTENIRVGCLVWYFNPRIIILRGTIPGIQVDSYSLGGDQTGILPWRREVGEHGLVEIIPQRRCCSTRT